MLINISEIITPELYEVLYKAGHMDEIVIVDANYYANALSNKNIFLPIKDNHNLLEEIIKYFPIDEDKEYPINVFKPDNNDKEEPQVWNDYRLVLEVNKDTKKIKINPITREEFYHRTKNAYATIQTLDSRLYANIIIRKGVVLII